MRILLSAYACGPNHGSEPGVGWGAAMSLAAHAEVHVLTTFESRESIQSEIAAGRVPETLRFHFYDLPGGAWWWKHGHGRGIQFHYALWQRLAGRVVRRLHKEFCFDAAQHVTFVRYWSPSCLRNSGIPYVFGPVGGADCPPRELVEAYSPRRRFKEILRHAFHWLGEHSPATRQTLRRAAHVFAATPRTMVRCKELGVPEGRLSLCQAIALSDGELKTLGSLPRPDKLVFFTLGRLDPLKGYDFALKAFASARIPDSRLLLIGGGSDEERLRSLGEKLGIADRVEITGFLPRKGALDAIAQGSVLLHPSHLDSGGTAVLESMAAGRPVICLDLGGPALLVDEMCGFKISSEPSDRIVDDIANAMKSLSGLVLRRSMSEAARERASSAFHWSDRGKKYFDMLAECAERGKTKPAERLSGDSGSVVSGCVSQGNGG